MALPPWLTKFAEIAAPLVDEAPAINALADAIEIELKSGDNILTKIVNIAGDLLAHKDVITAIIKTPATTPAAVGATS